MRFCARQAHSQTALHVPAFLFLVKWLYQWAALFPYAFLELAKAIHAVRIVLAVLALGRATVVVGVLARLLAPAPRVIDVTLRLQLIRLIVFFVCGAASFRAERDRMENAAPRQYEFAAPAWDERRLPTQLCSRAR